MKTLPLDEFLRLRKLVYRNARPLDYTLWKYLFENGAKSVEICSFLDKPERRIFPLDVKYMCFDIPNEFVVGYGLDYAYKYRQLPFVGVLKPEIYTK